MLELSNPEIAECIRSFSGSVQCPGRDAVPCRAPNTEPAVAPSQSVMELQAEHERLLRRVGLDPEARKYTPHVTLARLRDTSSFEVAEYLSARAAFRSPPFSVSRFVLFSSRASVGGGPYMVEAAYPLAA